MVKRSCAACGTKWGVSKNQEKQKLYVGPCCAFKQKGIEMIEDFRRGKRLKRKRGMYER